MTHHNRTYLHLLAVSEQRSAGELHRYPNGNCGGAFFKEAENIFPNGLELVAIFSETKTRCPPYFLIAPWRRFCIWSNLDYRAIIHSRREDDLLDHPDYMLSS